MGKIGNLENNSDILFLQAVRLMFNASFGKHQDQYEDAANKLRELADVIENGAPIPIIIDAEFAKSISMKLIANRIIG